MFNIRDVLPADLTQVYKFTIKLLRHHIGQCSNSLIDEESFVELFERGYLNGLILLHTPTDGILANGHRSSEAIGCMIYHPDVSTLHGHGIYLDQFYIEPDYRRLGLGRMMMTKLCEKAFASGGNYIKLTFQDGLGLENVYGGMGFVNYSKSSPGLHLFEAYGRPKLLELVNLGDAFTVNASHVTSQTNEPSSLSAMLILPLENTKQLTCPSWMPAFARLAPCINSTVPMLSPPAPRLVIITDGAAEHLPSAPPEDKEPGSQQLITPIMASCLNDKTSPRMCMFVEQCSICSWLGPMVNFTEFIGDTSLLDPKLLYNRVQYWLDMAPNLRGASWEVPCGDSSECNTLVRNLSQLNIPDDTKREGWNVAYLDANGMRRLMARAPSTKAQVQM